MAEGEKCRPAQPVLGGVIKKVRHTESSAGDEQ